MKKLPGLNSLAVRRACWYSPLRWVQSWDGVGESNVRYALLYMVVKKRERRRRRKRGRETDRQREGQREV